MKSTSTRWRMMPRVIAFAVASALVLGLTVPIDAGRAGGPLSVQGFVAPFQSVVVPVWFTDNDVAMVLMVGGDSSELELCLFDSNYNVSLGEGQGNFQVARLLVLRPGRFHIVVRNLGPFPNAFILRTN